jgi:hypothetical protein
MIELKEALDDIISGKVKFDVFARKLTPNDINKLLIENGFIHIDLDSNGWQHDFWDYYELDGIKLTHSGSWYYGQSILARDDAANDLELI